MNETSTDQAATATAPEEAPTSTEQAERKPAPPPLTLPGGHTETREIETQDIAEQTRPLTVRVDRLPSPFVRSGEPTRIHGSASDKRQEARRLEREADLLEKAQQKQAEEDRRFAELVRKEEDKSRADLLAEVKAMVKRCPGTVTAVRCPACAGSSPIMKSIVIPWKGHLDTVTSVGLGSPIFFMRRQKDDTYLCPRCGHTALAF